MADVRVQRSPSQPSRQEIDEHEAACHSVYRSWCRICIESRGIGQQHRAAEADNETSLPEVCMDYFYMSDETEVRPLPHIVLKCSKTQSYACTLLESKGVTKYGIDFIVGFVRDLGWKRLIFRSDGEPAMVALQRKVIEALAGIEVIVRHCPEDDHAANGAAESAVREMKRMIRAVKQSTEEKFGVRLTTDRSILAWIGRHAAHCLNRYRIGADGRTAETRRTGKRWRKPLVHLGERLMFKPLDVGRRKKTDLLPKMVCGFYVGHHQRTGAVLCMTEKGVQRGRGICRLPLKQNVGYHLIFRILWACRGTWVIEKRLLMGLWEHPRYHQPRCQCQSVYRLKEGESTS